MEIVYKYDCLFFECYFLNLDLFVSVWKLLIILNLIIINLLSCVVKFKAFLFVLKYL